MDAIVEGLGLAVAISSAETPDEHPDLAGYGDAAQAVAATMLELAQDARWSSSADLIEALAFGAWSYEAIAPALWRRPLSCYRFRTR